MGLFDWLRGRRLELPPDSVWPTAEAKLRGIVAAAGQALPDRAVLVLAHFPETIAGLQQHLEAQLSARRAGSGELASLLTSPMPRTILLALARELPELDPRTLPPPRGEGIEVLVAERHPLRVRDEAVAEVLEVLPPPLRLRFFLSLDDALLAGFIDDRLRGLLAKLGLSPDEEVTAGPLSAAIRRAQDQIRARSRGDHPAESAEEWLRVNLPPRGG